MFKYFIAIAAMCAVVFMFISCAKDNKDNSAEENFTKGNAYLEQNAKKPGVTVTLSGLQYEVLQPGTGKCPRETDKVRCNYEGRFIDGTVFDKTNPGNPATFPLNQVIPGWTEGLQLMQEGAKFRFTIPYFLGYGPNGYGPIPPYSVLVFDVELLEVL